MKDVRVSGAWLLIPESRFECLVLWLMGLYFGKYERTQTELYPMNRRWKLEDHPHV